MNRALLLRRLGVFTGYQPVASLLHGDLWGGNLAYLPDGSPVIYDPAVYYGDRETDLAMTELFGGFGADFTRRITRLRRWIQAMRYAKRCITCHILPLNLLAVGMGQRHG